MNPNVAFGGGGGKGPMTRTDLRVIAVVIGLCLAIFFAWMADQGAFKNPPKNHVQAVLTYVAVMGYKVSGDRVITFAISAVVFFSVMAVFGFAAFWFLEIYVIEPIVVKWKMIYVKREKKLMNKYDDGSI